MERMSAMINEKLLNFLCEKTVWEDLGNENLLHEFPEFGESVGGAINSGKMIDFTVELSGKLENMDLYKASLLSNFIGFACEKEEDTSAGSGVLKLFLRACQNVYEMCRSMEEEEECELPEPDEWESIYQKNEEWVRAYFGFNILCVTVMAFITRDAGLRKELADMGISEQIRYLAEDVPDTPYLKSVYYVNCMQKTCSDLKLLVLYPDRKKGFVATANDLNNCFHLIFLMEEQIYERLGEKYGMQGFYASESLTSLAHGNYPKDCWDESYCTYYMECDYSTASHENYMAEDMMSLIWGEMPPEAIPQIDGYGVIVLFEGGPSRSFSAQFLATPHEALDPYVEIVRELKDDEYDAWIDQIKK